MQTDVGKASVPTWAKVVQNARLFIQTYDREENDLGVENDDAAEDDAEVRAEQEDWMRLMQDIDNGLDERDTSPEAEEYWAGHRATLTDDVLENIDNWIRRQKETFQGINVPRPIVSLRRLNREQRRAYRTVKRHFEAQSVDQLLLRLEGTAGTGKSYVINALCNLLPECHFVSAPTGRAANNVGGSTLHSLLHLMNPEELKGQQLRMMQNRFKGVRYLIVDEYSMVGGKILHKIDRRLRQAMGRAQELFGGMSIILAGDYKQLPPVAVMSDLGAFESFTTVVVLTQIVRQEGPEQAAFRECLNNFRRGEAGQAEYDFLFPRTTGTARDTARFDDALYLMYTREEVRNHNMIQLERLNRIGHRTARLDALHNNKTAAALPQDQMQGLAPFVMIASGARVMITSNLWTEVGLTNGAMGTVRSIIFAEGVLPPALPRAVVVEMDDGYLGPCLPGMPRHVVINPKTVYSHSKGGSSETGSLERTQFPLMLAFVTIHKAQG